MKGILKFRIIKILFFVYDVSLGDVNFTRVQYFSYPLEIGILKTLACIADRHEVCDGSQECDCGCHGK
jgi:hypothetical protein